MLGVARASGISEPRWTRRPSERLCRWALNGATVPEPVGTGDPLSLRQWVDARWEVDGRVPHANAQGGPQFDDRSPG
jgi:hypothetical protein